uniref:Uncharacterized protein n=1 Tax=Anguilla anguilla TaxID=7936 RepID=A0A0E9RHI8_ANGAN
MSLPATRLFFVLSITCDLSMCLKLGGL